MRIKQALLTLQSAQYESRHEKIYFRGCDQVRLKTACSAAEIS